MDWWMANFTGEGDVPKPTGSNAYLIRDGFTAHAEAVCHWTPCGLLRSTRKIDHHFSLSSVYILGQVIEAKNISVILTLNK
jgi:hypothetical protein